MTKMHIIIDIGHANGTGARGNGAEEHAESRETAAALRRALVSRGYCVTLLDFPEQTNRADLNHTIAAANAMSAALGISLHMDAAATPAACGAHVCYISPRGETAARCIAPQICPVLPGRTAQIVRRTDLAILNRTMHPWVLVELGFITNAADLATVQTRRAELAERMAEGIATYLRAQRA